MCCQAPPESAHPADMTRVLLLLEVTAGESALGAGGATLGGPPAAGSCARAARCSSRPSAAGHQARSIAAPWGKTHSCPTPLQPVPSASLTGAYIQGLGWCALSVSQYRSQPQMWRVCNVGVVHQGSPLKRHKAEGVTRVATWIEDASVALARTSLLGPGKGPCAARGRRLAARVAQRKRERPNSAPALQRRTQARRRAVTPRRSSAAPRADRP